jgi:hypothetical protein
MKHNFLETLKELLANPNEMNMEKLKSFTQETADYFKALQKKAESSDEKEKAAAIEEALNIKKELEMQMGALATQAGMAPEDLMKMAAEQLPFNLTEFRVIEQAKSNLIGQPKREAPRLSPQLIQPLVL